MYADVGGCSDTKEAQALLLFTAVFVHGSESRGLQMALQRVMNEH